MVVVLLVYFIFGALTPVNRGKDEFLLLLDADSHNLWLVSVLNVNVNWHGVLPLP